MSSARLGLSLSNEGAVRETVAGLEYLRDFYLARTIFDEAELRGMLNEFSARGGEEARIRDRLSP